MFYFREIYYLIMILNTNKYPPWNNEPAPFGSLSAIFLGKIFGGTKKNFFFRGKTFFGGKNEFF